MIYPIIAYGDSVLKKVAQEINRNDTSLDLKKLVEDMYETMYNANGVGLAAPQIGLSLRLFVIDADRMDDDIKGMKKVFINAKITEQDGDRWAFEEGCLSIPNIREDVYRQPKIRIHYFDENWNEYDEIYEGLVARVIQHEYDHIEGVLFTDYLSGFKKTLLKSKLNNISRGNVKVEYRMKFPLKK
jgi:peptide deformylase